jgi:hypothetical protein
MLSLTATELFVVPSRGQSRLKDPRQFGSEISIQIKSIVALALAAPAKPTRAITLPIVIEKNFRIVPFRRSLRVL